MRTGAGGTSPSEKRLTNEYFAFQVCFCTTAGVSGIGFVVQKRLNLTISFRKKRFLFACFASPSPESFGFLPQKSLFFAVASNLSVQTPCQHLVEWRLTP